jgi:hypothetical protein
MKNKPFGTFTISGTLTLVTGAKARGAAVQLKQSGAARGNKVTAGEEGTYSLFVSIGEGYTDTVSIGSIPPRGWKPGNGGIIIKNNTLIDTIFADRSGVRL